MFNSMYCSVLTETYKAGVIINAGVFCSLVLMMRRCFNDETECVLPQEFHKKACNMLMYRHLVC